MLITSIAINMINIKNDGMAGKNAMAANGSFSTAIQNAIHTKRATVMREQHPPTVYNATYM